MNNNSINIILNIIKNDTDITINKICNEKAREVFIAYLETEEGSQWLNDTYIKILKGHFFVSDVKTI